uniref:Putative DUF3472 protein n=1 Tax=Vesanto virus TaxID=1955786 RepID=A0A7D5ABH2_9VIRU|nr:putative DUF3472 protein [Vesanto virus]
MESVLACVLGALLVSSSLAVVNITYSEDVVLDERAAFNRNEYKLSVFSSNNRYSDRVETYWRGEIDELQKQVEINSYTSCQLEKNNARISAGVVKTEGELQARLVVTLEDAIASQWEVLAYSDEFTCSGVTCTSVYAIKQSEDLEFGFVFSIFGRAIYVFSKYIRGTSALIAVFGNVNYQIGQLIPWGYAFEMSDVSTCADLPTMRFVMEPSKLIDDENNEIVAAFDTVSSSIQHECDINVQVSAELAILTMEPSAPLAQPIIENDVVIGSVNTRTCSPSSWANVKKDCSEGTQYCDSNVWFNANLHFNNLILASDKWTNMYYAFMTTDTTDMVRQHYYAYYTPIGYTGFQPQSNGDIRFVFSTFSRNTNPLASTCSPGADGGPGVSCAVRVSGISANEIFYIKISRVGEDAVFQGQVLHGNKQYLIGKYSFDDASMVDKPSSIATGFVENFISTNHMDSCCDCPKTDAVVFAPFSTDSDGAYGQEMFVGQYGSTCSANAFNLGYTNYDFDLVFEDGQVRKLAAVHIWKGWVDTPVLFRGNTTAPGIQRVRFYAPFNSTSNDKY